MRDHYRIGDLLGTGAYGQVRKCVYKENMKDRNSAVKQYRAVKILSKAHMEDKDIDAFKEEVACMMVLQKENVHPSLVRLYHIFEDPKRLLLVQELFTGGDLYDYMSANKSKLEPHDAAIIIKQVLAATRRMHQNHFVHRDLKPENVMLEREGDISDVKIIDFGTALRWDSHIQAGKDTPQKKLLISGRKGTPNYMAPEVFKAKSGDEHSAQKYNELSDMWSIGIIAYILCTNKDPFLLWLASDG